MRVILLRGPRQNDRELSGHAEMHHQEWPSVQFEQQPLAATVDGLDPAAEKHGFTLLRPLIPQRLPAAVNAQEGSSNQQGTQITRDGLDLGEFRHPVSVVT